MLQMRICSDVVFSRNEHFNYPFAEMLQLLHFTAKLSVSCCMLIGVLFSLNGTFCFIVCMSAVHILYELYTVK